MAIGSSTGKKGSKKTGRLLRSPSHTRYINTGRARLNKMKRIKKHLKRCQTDTGKKDLVAIKALKKLDERR